MVTIGLFSASELKENLISLFIGQEFDFGWKQYICNLVVSTI